MAFAGGFGAAAAQITAGNIELNTGEGGDSYDADGRLVVGRASGSLYTPARIDTIQVLSKGGNPLGAIVAGGPDPANVDTGELVSAVPGANQHGLPANFGPGRGKWTERDLNRIRVWARPSYTKAVNNDTAGMMTETGAILVGGDVVIRVRNHDSVAVGPCVLIVELTHSVQG